MKVLILNPVMQRDLHLYQDRFEKAGIQTICPPLKQFLSENELLPFMGEVDGVIAGDDEFTKRVLEAGLPRLKVISKWGVGLDSIDLVAAKELGIPVFNSPGAFSVAVAEVAIGYMLMLSRHLNVVDTAVRNGEWPKPEGAGLQGKVLGIVGYGAIGRAVGERAEAFSMQVNAFDIMSAKMSAPSSGTFLSFEEICATSDYICLCCNLTDDNFHLIDDESIKLMDRKPYLINVGRGPLVDEASLIRALNSGAIQGAALDVYEIEPLPADSELKTFSNLILGSHNANNMTAANNAVNENTVSNLINCLSEK